MDWKRFKAEWDRIIAKNLTFRYVIALLSLLLLVEGLVIVALYNRQRVVFVPPKVDREFWIAGNYTSTSYLEMMGEYVAERVLNVTESNVVDRFNSILPLLSSSNYAEVRASLTKQADQVVKNAVSQVFYHKKTEVDQKHSTIAVHGILKRMVSDQVVARTGVVAWIKYRIAGGRFEVEDIAVTESTKNPFVSPPSSRGGKS